MTAIPYLTATESVTAGDLLVVWKQNAGDTRKAAFSVAADYFSSAFSTLTVSDWIKVTATTVAGLPSPTDAGEGAKAHVTDATATTFASVVAGGGANSVPVYCDGTNWRIG